jgi:Spy/CpxP family protein refolding chaperone
MKKILVSLLAIAAVTFSAAAQTTDNSTAKKDNLHKEWKHHNKEMVMDQLNLTQSQKDQLKALHENYRKQMQELNKNESITVKEFRDKKYALKKQQKADFLALLTPDQKTKLDQLKQQRQQQHEMMAAKKLDKMKLKLNLTDDQVAQIKANRENIHSKIKAIKDNDNLSRTEKKEQLETLKSENKGSFKKILTPDQLNKLEEMKKSRMDKNPT